MRKVLTLFLAAGLVLAFTLPVQAAGSYLGSPDFKFRGWYMLQGYTTDNITDFDDNQHDARRAAFSRFRWWFDTNFEGKYGGTIGLEWNWTWGEDPNDSTYYETADTRIDQVNAFGAQPAPIFLTQQQVVGATGHTGGMGDDQTNNLRMKHAYVWFMIPRTPVKITGGLASNIIDPNFIMFGSNTDWWSVRLDVPLIKGMLNISGAWMKQDEGRDDDETVTTASFATPGTVVPFTSPAFTTVTTTTAGAGGIDRDSDDSDYWWVNITGSPLKWLSFGTYFNWLHVRNNGFTALDGNTARRARFPGSEGDYFWYGVHGNVNFGRLSGRLHFNYWWGDQKSSTKLVNGVPKTDLDPTGWALLGRVRFNFGPANLGIRGWWLTGNDDEDVVDTDGDGINDTIVFTDWNRWSTPDAWFAPFEIFYGGGRMWATTNSDWVGSPGGSAALALTGGWNVTKKLYLGLIAGYVWATRSADKPAETFLNPWTGESNSDKGLGFEIDARAEYKIYDHLALDLVAAYVIADDGMARADPAGGFNKDDAYELFWRLVYSF